MTSEVGSQADLAEGTPAEAAGQTQSDRRSLWAAILSIGFLGMGFLVVTNFWSFETSYVLDDYGICTPGMNVKTYWAQLWSLTGLYRPLTYPVTAFRNLTCDIFWIHKVLGVTLHLLIAGGLWRFGRLVGMRTPAAFVASAAFIFNPFALEAIAWPAVVYGYPLTGLFLVGYAITLLSTDRILLPLLLGLAAVMTNEQTLPLIVVLPLVLTQTSWKSRFHRGALVVGPILLAFGAVVVSGNCDGVQPSLLHRSKRAGFHRWESRRQCRDAIVAASRKCAVARLR